MTTYRFTLAFEFNADDDVQARAIATNLQRSSLPDMTAKLQAVYADRQPRQVKLGIENVKNGMVGELRTN